MNDEPDDTPEQVKSEWALSPEEAARVESGHREMTTAEATTKLPPLPTISTKGKPVDE